MLGHWLDTYCWVDSPVRRLPTAYKLPAAVIGVTLTVLLPIAWWYWFIGWFGVVLALMWLSRIPGRIWLQRLLILEPFVLGISVLSLWQEGGVFVFFGILLRSTLSLLTMIVLSQTTPFVEILRIMQVLRVPALLITTLALMYRYLHVLVEELSRMQRARASRTFQKKRPHLWRALGCMAGQLFVRSSERAERIYSAMCSRGWKS